MTFTVKEGVSIATLTSNTTHRAAVNINPMDPQGGLGMEFFLTGHLAHRFPFAELIECAKDVRAEIVAEGEKLKAWVAGLTKMGRKDDPQLVPSVLTSIREANSEAFKQINRRVVRMDSMIKVVTAACSHGCLFPLDNPASARDLLTCPCCKAQVLSGEVVRLNSMTTAKQLKEAWVNMVQSPANESRAIMDRLNSLTQMFPGNGWSEYDGIDPALTPALRVVVDESKARLEAQLKKAREVNEAFYVDSDSFLGMVFLSQTLHMTNITGGNGLDNLRAMVGAYADQSSNLRKWARQQTVACQFGG